MGKHTANEDLQANADQFDQDFADSTARAEANAPTADERIAALKASQSEYRRLYGRRS